VSNETLWTQFRSNFPRELLALTRYIQSETMDIMAREAGYDDLRLSFEPYMSTIGAGGTTLSALAQDLGISKQAASQTIIELEKLGYISRDSSKSDGRSKLLQITPRGAKLLNDGLHAYQAVESELLKHTTERALVASYKTLETLCVALELGPPIARLSHSGMRTLGVLLSRASDYLQQRLLQLASKRGHSGLKLSYAHVLTLLRPGGTRIQDIVRIRNLSKQAVGAIANELSKAGYLERRADPESPRQQRLHLTEQGMALIADSVESVEILNQELTNIVGEKAFDAFKRFMSDQYRGLQLEQIEFGDLFDPELEARARTLVHELGADRARALGRILLT
jgi:DNA-binding MarR family transcriptional regulator